MLEFFWRSASNTLASSSIRWWIICRDNCVSCFGIIQLRSRAGPVRSCLWDVPHASRCVLSHCSLHQRKPAGVRLHRPQLHHEEEDGALERGNGTNRPLTPGQESPACLRRSALQACHILLLFLCLQLWVSKWCLVCPLTANSSAAVQMCHFCSEKLSHAPPAPVTHVTVYCRSSSRDKSEQVHPNQKLSPGSTLIQSQLIVDTKNNKY